MGCGGSYGDKENDHTRAFPYGGLPGYRSTFKAGAGGGRSSVSLGSTLMLVAGGGGGAGGRGCSADPTTGGNAGAWKGEAGKCACDDKTKGGVGGVADGSVGVFKRGGDYAGAKGNSGGGGGDGYYGGYGGGTHCGGGGGSGYISPLVFDGYANGDGATGGSKSAGTHGDVLLEFFVRADGPKVGSGVGDMPPCRADATHIPFDGYVYRTLYDAAAQGSGKDTAQEMSFRKMPRGYEVAPDLDTATRYKVLNDYTWDTWSVCTSSKCYGTATFPDKDAGTVKAYSTMWEKNADGQYRIKPGKDKKYRLLIRSRCDCSATGQYKVLPSKQCGTVESAKKSGVKWFKAGTPGFDTDRSWAEARGFCIASGYDGLCTHSQICPDGKTPFGGAKGGDVWTPIADIENEYM